MRSPLSSVLICLENILRLTREVPKSLCQQDMSFEIRSVEEAPILGARLITNTPLDLDLPKLHMKLGSTRGTNALLERKGADVVLFVTRGFKDILEIGNQQRPDIFALEVVKREMLYRQVVEIEERIDAKGNVIVPLNTKDFEKKLIEAKRKGFASAAICLLNAYINPVHEIELAGLLRRRGVSDISVSTDLSPLIKYVNRTETATVNAYLNPVFRNYLDNVKDAISNGRIHVMTSAGGLIREEQFSAKDSLLSGPAGGVVGAVNIGKRNGLDHIISFDMGGTSTDVSRYDGEYDYRYDLEVGGAHISVPLYPSRPSQPEEDPSVIMMVLSYLWDRKVPVPIPDRPAMGPEVPLPLPMLISYWAGWIQPHSGSRCSGRKPVRN